MKNSSKQCFLLTLLVMITIFDVTAMVSDTRENETALM
jgi:hypothetical protein